MIIKILFSFLALASLSPAALAEIREIKTMNQIVSEVDLQTLLVFDLDETIINNRTIPISPVEKITPQLIENYQRLGVKVMALTARPVVTSRVTYHQLLSLGVDFSKSLIQAESFLKKIVSPWRYRHGIEFSGIVGDKGKALVGFLKERNYQPKKVVMVDDKLKNCVSVNRALDAAQIPNIEFRYGAADH